MDITCTILITFRKIKPFANQLSSMALRNGPLSRKNYAVKATMNAPESSVGKGRPCNYLGGIII